MTTQSVTQTRTILVVDDEPAVLQTVADILEAHGYRVLKAASGEAALEIARAQAAPITLLLTVLVRKIQEILRSPFTRPPQPPSR